jgi:hypothetical protein
VSEKSEMGDDGLTVHPRIPLSSIAGWVYEALFKSKNSSHTGSRSETYDVGLYSHAFHTQVDNSELRVSIDP